MTHLQHLLRFFDFWFFPFALVCIAIYWWQHRNDAKEKKEEAERLAAEEQKEKDRVDAIKKMIYPD